MRNIPTTGAAAAAVNTPITPSNNGSFPISAVSQSAAEMASGSTSPPPSGITNSEFLTSNGSVVNQLVQANANTTPSPSPPATTSHADRQGMRGANQHRGPGTGMGRYSRSSATPSTRPQKPEAKQSAEPEATPTPPPSSKSKTRISFTPPSEQSAKPDSASPSASSSASPSEQNPKPDSASPSASPSVSPRHAPRQQLLQRQRRDTVQNSEPSSAPSSAAPSSAAPSSAAPSSAAPSSTAAAVPSASAAPASTTTPSPTTPSTDWATVSTIVYNCVGAFAALIGLGGAFTAIGCLFSQRKKDRRLTEIQLQHQPRSRWHPAPPTQADLDSSDLAAELTKEQTRPRDKNSRIAYLCSKQDEGKLSPGQEEELMQLMSNLS